MARLAAASASSRGKTIASMGERSRVPAAIMATSATTAGRFADANPVAFLAFQSHCRDAARRDGGDLFQQVTAAAGGDDSRVRA